MNFSRPRLPEPGTELPLIGDYGGPSPDGMGPAGLRGGLTVVSAAGDSVPVGGGWGITVTWEGSPSSLRIGVCRDSAEGAGFPVRLGGLRPLRRANPAWGSPSPDAGPLGTGSPDAGSSTVGPRILERIQGGSAPAEMRTLPLPALEPGMPGQGALMVGVERAEGDSGTSIRPWSDLLLDGFRQVAAVGAVPGAAVVFSTDPGAGSEAVAPELPGWKEMCAQLGLEARMLPAAEGGPEVVVVVGLLDDAGRGTAATWKEPGDSVYFLDGSGLMGAAGDDPDGPVSPVPPSLEAERHLADILVGASRDGMVDMARAVGVEGLGAALARTVRDSGVGARVFLDALAPFGPASPEALLSARASSALVAVPRSEEVRFTDMCSARGFPHARIGVVDDHAAGLEVQGRFTLAFDELGGGTEGSSPEDLPH